VDRLARVTGGQLGVGAVIGIRVLREVRKGAKDVGWLPTGGFAVGLLPQKDTPVLLTDGPDSEHLGPVGTILIGDVSVHTVGPPTPAMERTLDTVAVHAPSVPDMGTEVEAVGVKDMELPGLIAVGHKVLPEVTKGSHLGDGKLD
jgi:hypothetical protein